MTTTIIFIRHADTQKDPNLHAALWKLSEKGSEQAKQLVFELEQNELVTNIAKEKPITKIYTSSEIKTKLTIEPFAHKHNLDITHLDNFDEVRRGEKFLSKEEFEQEKKKQLQDLDYKAFDGESGNEALVRFNSGIETLLANEKEETIIVVSHGTILNIYFANLLQDFENISKRWSKTDFCSYGIVEYKKDKTTLVKDICF